MTVALTNNGQSRHDEAVLIDDLQVDHRYQRELDQRLVERIREQFDMVVADIISVSKRADGSLYIINGQHRAAAAKLEGETHILAFIYEGLTLKQEAEYRLKFNNMRLDRPLEKFHAQITAGDPTALAIVRICEEFETRVNRSANSHTGINCVSTLRDCFVESEELFVRTMRALTDSYGNVKGEVAQSTVIKGVFWFLKVHHGEYNYSSFTDRMDKAGIKELMQRKVAYKSATGGADWLNYYRALVEMYNYKRPEHTRLELKTKYSIRLEPGGSSRAGGGKWGGQ